MVDKKEKQMFKVGDRVVRRIGFLGEIDPNSPIGTVEALRTFEEDVCSNGGVRVLWEGNKRGYWTESSNLKLQPKPKQKTVAKFKVGDLVEIVKDGSCTCGSFVGNRGTVASVDTSDPFGGPLYWVEIDQDPYFPRISFEAKDLKSLPKQEPKKEKLSWAALDELIAKNNAMKFEVGDLVEADVSHTRGVIYEIATNDYGAKVAHVVNVGTYLWFTSLKLIKTAAEMQKVVAAIPVPKHEFAVGDVVKTTLTNQEVLLTSRIDKCCGGSKRWTGLRYDNGFFTVVFSETDLTFVRHSENAAAFAAILNEIKSF